MVTKIRLGYVNLMLQSIGLSSSIDEYFFKGQKQKMVTHKKNYKTIFLMCHGIKIFRDFF